MVQFKAALWSTLLASAGLVAAYPASAPYAQSVALEEHGALIARAVDPARIDAIRNRVNRPKEVSGPEPEPKLLGDKKVAHSPSGKPPFQAAGSVQPPKGPNQNSNPPKQQLAGPPQKDKSTPKPPPKALLPGANKLATSTGDQPQQAPILRGSRPSHNAKKGGSGKLTTDSGAAPRATPQSSKITGGTSSQPNPSTNISRGGNAARPDGKDPKRAKVERKGKPKVQNGSGDLEGSERVARDAVEGAGVPKDRAQPSKDLKALKKPNTKNKQGSVGKGGLQIKPPQSQPQASPGASESGPAPRESAQEDHHGGFGADGADDDEENYFEWFRARDKTPTKYVVKAKDGYKSQYKLDQGEDGLEKLPTNQRRRELQQKGKDVKANEGVENISAEK
ncbi:hypothetical protein BGX38DRAFT_38927 [Terfezia claveryi]|nr:hypothetical protein BGX38DRAFT_38927 [Terfezia claveryi]